jgi:uncharacterized protein YjbJ (UPF0337 family)
MKGSTKDRIEGKFHEVKGSIKAAVGNAVHSPSVSLAGHTEKIAGKAQETRGKAQKTIGK